MRCPNVEVNAYPDSGMVIAGGNTAGRDINLTVNVDADRLRPRIPSKAIREGLIQAFRLTETVQEIKGLEEAGQWSEAADLLGSVAEVLEENQYAPAAEGFRRRQAQALVRSGEADQGAEILLGLSWRAILERLAPLSAHARGIDADESLGDSLSEPVRDSWNFLPLAAAAFTEHEDLGEDLVEPLARLAREAPFWLEAAVSQLSGL